MKKIISLIIVCLLILFSFTSCNFFESIAETVVSETESAPKVEEMLTALVNGQTDNATALLHPDIDDEASLSAIYQLSSYIEGRSIEQINQLGVKINTSLTTDGEVKTENITYQLIFADGESVYIQSSYVYAKEMSGFSSFQLVLGII